MHFQLGNVYLHIPGFIRVLNSRHFQRFQVILDQFPGSPPTPFQILAFLQVFQFFLQQMAILWSLEVGINPF